jgi:hypothetical protein
VVPYFQPAHFQATFETAWKSGRGDLADANRRTDRFAAAAYPFAPDAAHATAIILSLAAGEVSEESLTGWIRDNWPSE